MSSSSDFKNIFWPSIENLGLLPATRLTHNKFWHHLRQNPKSDLKKSQICSETRTYSPDPEDLFTHATF